MYAFDPERIDLAGEFRRNPFGQHSPDLQYLLNLMRTPCDGPFHVLIVESAGQRWRVASMFPARAPALQLTDIVVHSPEEAEWVVFKLRWQALGGRPLAD